MTRIPESLRRRLEREAARNDRSMNAEIIHRLEHSFITADLVSSVATAAQNTIVEILGPDYLARMNAAAIATKKGDKS
jgi:hypothetical protein